MAFDIDRVAELARLNLKPDEKQKLSRDLEKILSYVDSLSTVKTGSVEPTSHVMDLENVFREDRVECPDIREKVLSHAPLREGPFFKVPKTVDKSA